MAVFLAALGLLASVACAFGELTDSVLHVYVENVDSRFSKTTKTPVKHCVVSKIWKHYTDKWSVMLTVPHFLQMIWIGNRVQRDVCVCVCVCVCVKDLWKYQFFLPPTWSNQLRSRGMCVCVSVCVCLCVYTWKYQYWWLLKKTCENSNFFASHVI